MKLWIACFSSQDCSRIVHDTGFVVAAPDLSECARVAEAHVALPGTPIATDFESWASIVFELTCEVPDGEPRVLFGPFQSLGAYWLGETCWRRDEGDPFWVNVSDLRTGKDVFECIYDDPRGWPRDF